MSSHPDPAYRRRSGARAISPAAGLTPLAYVATGVVFAFLCAMAVGVL
ncbi:MAG: hypothetical protein H6923_08375 [Alphaproteobacteria bacterium]|nr:hypothetical protein [Alphaproteobacteria bacterium]